MFSRQIASKKNLLPQQQPMQLVDVKDWLPDWEFSPYPKGAREKSALFCPSECSHPFLIPKHRYLFKHSSRRYPDQFWVEIVAYQLGEVLGIPVPPTFVAWDSQTQACCALIEWFYGYPQQSEIVRYVDGGEYMTRLIPNYDRKTGKQHNFLLIADFLRGLQTSGVLPEDWLRWWAETLLLDTLLGNTDRHQENWGLLWYGQSPTHAQLAPAFDNGTALGHEIFPNKFERFYTEAAHIERYVQKGRHHMRWANGNPRQSHIDLLMLFLQAYPMMRTPIETCLARLDFTALAARILDLCAFDLPVPLRPERADFMLYLLAYRVRKVEQALTKLSSVD